MYIPLKLMPKKTLFVADVSINWVTDSGRPKKVAEGGRPNFIDSWKVNQMN